MKKVIVLFLFFGLLSQDAMACGKKKIKFKKGKFEQVLEYAQKKNKIVFIDFWADWCAPCKRMDKTVLNDKEVIAFFNKNFVNFKLDAESADAIIPKINYDVRSLPAYVWVRPNGEVLVNYKGTTTKTNFLRLAKSAVSLK